MGLGLAKNLSINTWYIVSGASRQIIRKFLDNDDNILSFSSCGFTSSQIEPDVSHIRCDNSGECSTSELALSVALISASRWSCWRFKYSENNIPPFDREPGLPRKLDRFVKLPISN